jgi:hypothetical protein
MLSVSKCWVLNLNRKTCTLSQVFSGWHHISALSCPEKYGWFYMFEKGAFLQGIQLDGDTKWSSHSEKDQKLQKICFRKIHCSYPLITKSISWRVLTLEIGPWVPDLMESPEFATVHFNLILIMALWNETCSLSHSFHPLYKGDSICLQNLRGHSLQCMYN